MKLIFKLLLMLVTMFAVALPTFADTLTVTNTQDDGPGSLRYTCMNAKSGDVIIFAPELSGQTITLLSVIQPEVDLTIDGSALADTLTITTDLKATAFYTSDDTNTKYIRLKFHRCEGALFGGSSYNCSFTENIGGVMYDVNVTGGGGITGGNAYECVFIDNDGNYGGAMRAGKAYNCMFIGNSGGYGTAMWGSLAYNCIFIKNHGHGVIYGGAAYNSIFTDNEGSAIDEGYALNCTFIGNKSSAVYESWAANCTFIGNRAEQNGGAAFESELYQCTIINNTAINGGGVYGGKLFNCVLAHNTASGKGPDVYGSITSFGGNVVANSDSSYNWAPNDRIGTSASPLDPMLDDTVRSANGQLYFTLRPGSPALGFGRDTLPFDTPDMNQLLCYDICGNPRPNKCIDAGSFQQSKCTHTQLLGGCKPSSLPEAAVKQPFSLYPNPTTAGFTLRLTSEPQNLSVEVFDLTGRKLLFQTLTQKETDMNINSLPAGVYVVKVGNFGAKLIKE